jgi:hypothetical protein
MVLRMRLVLAALALVLCGGPADTEAQPARKPHRIGFLGSLRAAKGLGLAVPPSVLARADEVLQ